MRLKVTIKDQRWSRRIASIFIRIAFAVAAVLSLLAVVAGCGEESATVNVTTVGDTGGRLQIRETYFDAGTVKTGQLAEHKFELRNTGSGPLSLGQLDVKRLEGC